ncbi:MAG: YcaO-like family protein, partial [Acetobacteraceae bacterium]|nr:YcaO-like family protein [Acetobacteraceae bacterium]
ALALEDPATARAAALLTRLRRASAGRRRSWLLDITTEFGVPVVAALSFGPEGRGFCCGFAARAGGLAAAAEAAILEMAQMELAQALVEAKARTLGEAALNPRDGAHRRRYHGIDAATCVAVHPALPPAPPAHADAGPSLPPEGAPADAALAAVLPRLAAHGLAPLRLDLAGPGEARTGVEVPVLRMLCPGLETEGACPPGPRLRAALAETGGGDGHAPGIQLT